MSMSSKTTIGGPKPSAPGSNNDHSMFLTQPPEGAETSFVTRDAETHRSKRSKDKKDPSQWDISHWQPLSQHRTSVASLAYKDSVSPPKVSGALPASDRPHFNQMKIEQQRAADAASQVYSMHSVRASSLPQPSASTTRVAVAEKQL